MGSSPLNTEKLKPRKSTRVPFERRIIRSSLWLAFPGLTISGILIWLQSWTIESKLTLLVAELVVCGLILLALHDQIIRPLQTLANVVGALREEDYSFRARMAVPDDALGELSLEVNMLADLLAEHRIGAIEATALLQRVVEEVDIPLFAFDPGEALRLVNSAGERLLRQASPRLLSRTATELGLKTCLSAANASVIPLHFNTDARWFLRRSSFRQRGVPHTLVVLSDVSRALREEERLAWQRLIRVMGHELNNSLTPIKSIAGSLHARLSGTKLAAEEREDFERGLGIIEARAASLNRFLQAYRQLALMPPPVLKESTLSPLVMRVTGLETRIEVKVIAGPDAIVMADSDQLEQMLINLVRNAVEAVLERSPSTKELNEADHLPKMFEPSVVISWKLLEKVVDLTIEDNGPGLLNPSNAFVPFYTTKPSGSGIGLVLSRQIAEAHGGSLELTNRPHERGCKVRVTLLRPAMSGLQGSYQSGIRPGADDSTK
jgi:two-component system, NtrC family, nitrogen regulation sensor histidine kinase NtrY